MVAPTRDVKNSGADPPAAIQVALGMAGCCWMLLEYLDSTAQTSWLVPEQLMDQLFHPLAGREQKTLGQ